MRRCGQLSDYALMWIVWLYGWAVPATIIAERRGLSASDRYTPLAMAALGAALPVAGWEVWMFLLAGLARRG